MITTINEFLFTKHYLYDSNARFNLRINNVNIMNTNIDKLKVAHERLKKALYYYGLELLDKAKIATTNAVITFGDIYFKENGKLIQANLSVDKSTGNNYIVVISDNNVITLKLLPSVMDNKTLLLKGVENDIKNVDGAVLYDINMNKLSLDGKLRPKLIIDLDINDIEYSKLYPTPILKNNKYPDKNSGLSEIEIEDMLKYKKESEKTDIFALKVIGLEAKKIVPNKEYVIYPGMEIYVNYPDGPKLKKITELIIDEKGSVRKFALRFANTAKILDLSIGMPFIISPKIENDVYDKLINAFDLESGVDLHFQGPITKFNYYDKKKTKTINKLGVIIDPRYYF